MSQAINWTELTGWVSLDWAAKATQKRKKKTERPLRFTRLSGDGLACWIAATAVRFCGYSVDIEPLIHISPSAEPKVRSRK
jgi:hypothetical protein